MPLLIIVDQIEEFRWSRPGDRIATADEYFRGDLKSRCPNTRVINFCKRQDYLGTAHFCSMIAEARNQTALPNSDALLRLSQRELWAEQLKKLNHTLLAGVDQLRHGTETFTLFFGKAVDAELQAIGAQIYSAFPFPLLRIAISFGPIPMITQLVPLALSDVTQQDAGFFRAALDRFAKGGAGRSDKRSADHLRLAILHDPNEPLPPSRMPTLHKFVQIGADMDIEVELVRHRDLSRLGEFDALFIRETTAINHHTYRFAEKAERLGIPVIDDPASIRRCTNKVYLAELLGANDVPSPRTWLLHRETFAEFEAILPFPVVLKKPDGAFGVGVERAATPYEFRSIAAKMLEHSELIVAQEFIASDFDWRIGVLAGQPLFAARYFMCPRHWQILKHGCGSHTEGETQAVAVSDVPENVVRQAIRAANLVGDGLYGVDLKQTNRGPMVIEVNDNPNIEIGMEDGVVGDQLYREILDRFRLLVGRSLAGRHRCLAASPPHQSRRYRSAAPAAA
jgi:glutathione synthase/RimK-type ligase-like ATP-grasp enzyme